MEEQRPEKKSSFTFPLVLGGMIGGGIALAMAPQLVKARGALLRGYSRVRQVMSCVRQEPKREQPAEGSAYCSVDKGADICYPEGRPS